MLNKCSWPEDMVLFFPLFFVILSAKSESTFMFFSALWGILHQLLKCIFSIPSLPAYLFLKDTIVNFPFPCKPMYQYFWVIAYPWRLFASKFLQAKFFRTLLGLYRCIVQLLIAQKQHFTSWVIPLQIQFQTSA